MTGKADQTGVLTLLSADRLASLNDTIFGVAMTLLVTTLLPSVQAYRGSVLDMPEDLKTEFGIVVLSFAMSGRY